MKTAVRYFDQEEGSNTILLTVLLGPVSRIVKYESFVIYDS